MLGSGELKRPRPRLGCKAIGGEEEEEKNCFAKDCVTQIERNFSHKLTKVLTETIVPTYQMPRRYTQEYRVWLHCIYLLLRSLLQQKIALRV
jgi:hypothetical protein